MSHRRSTLAPYLVLILAVLSRLLPHALHGVGLNFTAVGGGLLFFGARRSTWHALTGAAVMALTDVYLTRVVYGLPFHVGEYAVTWAWYVGVCLLGHAVLRRVTVARVLLAVFCSATSFFLLSNLSVWVGSGMYAHSVAGMALCYWLAVPFYMNDLVSTGLTTGVLFGLPVAASALLASWRTVAQREPLG